MYPLVGSGTWGFQVKQEADNSVSWRDNGRGGAKYCHGKGYLLAPGLELVNYSSCLWC